MLQRVVRRELLRRAGQGIGNLSVSITRGADGALPATEVDEQRAHALRAKVETQRESVIRGSSALAAFAVHRLMCWCVSWIGSARDSHLIQNSPGARFLTGWGA